MYQRKHRFDDVHPLRWRRSRPFSAALLRSAAEHGAGKYLTQDMVQASQRDIMEAYNPAIMRLPREKRPERALDVITGELGASAYAASFWDGNRNVVAMDPSILELLSHTDADNVPMAAIRWTHPYLYVALPQGSGISMPGSPNEFDGAYVDTRYEGRIQFFLTTRRTDVETKRRTWPLSIEPSFAFSEELEDGETVGGFVTRCIEKRVASLLSTEHEAGRQQAVREANDDEEIGHAAGRHFESVAQRNNALRADEAEEALPAAARALALVVNLMCYLSTEPPLKKDYCPQPPKGLHDRVHSGTDRQKRLAREEMARLGILPIMVAGRNSEPTAADREERGLPTGRTPGAHWRRGYYNTYWTGTGRTVPRIRWIAPQIINAHMGEARGIHVHPVT